MNRLAWQLILAFLFCLIPIKHSLAENSISIAVSDDNEISIEQYAASGDYLIIWTAPEYGFRGTHRNMARMLSEHNIEVWLADVVDSLFLPQGSSSIKQLSGQYIADLIEQAHKITAKRILVAGDSYATLSALTGAHQWQQRQHKDNYFVGAILFSPYTYASIPPLGELPEYMPIVSTTNIPLMVYQATGSGTFNQFQILMDKLQQHGNPVYTRMVPGIMSLYYEDPPSKQMIEQARRLPANVSKMIVMLDKHEVPDKVIPLPEKNDIQSGIDVQLKSFSSHIKPVAIDLQDTEGKSFIKKHYRDQVTLVNFWATWCPPCIEEIPSLNRLNQKMRGLPFELISINYAEDKQTIEKFMKQVDVNFPVLLDYNGEFSKQWQVITYPSTFVIDKRGVIRYGVNAAIEWDDPGLIKILTALSHE